MKTLKSCLTPRRDPISYIGKARTEESLTIPAQGNRWLSVLWTLEETYLKLPKEMNPFLGFREIRLCLEEQAVFRTQLRALLRAGVYGNLKIMFPMIATVSEFREAKSILMEEKEKLAAEGVKVAEQIWMRQRKNRLPRRDGLQLTI
ncbi:hypothetical protein P40081_27675 [Paenibacillus sp. FSL P4-0081]|nr:hypothetical protein P40081_27675 [Paenibacillus sp. FSL P4-0081]